MFIVQCRHKEFLPANRVHFFTDNLRDFLHNTPTERQVTIYTGGVLINKSALIEEFGIDAFSVSRGAFTGFGKELGITHKEVYWFISLLVISIINTIAIVILYTPNHTKLCFSINRNNHLMATSAVRNETKNPTPSNTNCSPEKLPAFFTKSSPVAAAMVGMARRNENSTIVLRFNPSRRPPTMAAAARETPGMKPR